MPTHDRLVAHLARCVERFREADSKAERKAEFRALMSLLETESLVVRVAEGRMTVNGSPVDGAAAVSLGARLALHGVAAVMVPRGALPAEVFELVKVLAGQPGIEDGVGKLDMAGSGRVSVTRAPATPAPPRQPLEQSAPPSAPSPHPSGLGIEGILRGEPMTDIASPDVQVPGVSSVTQDPLAPSPESALPTKGNVKPSGALPNVAPSSGPAALAPAPEAPSPLPPPPAAPAPQGRPSASAPDEASPPGVAPAGARAPTADTLVRALEAAPESPNVGDLLAALGPQVEEALRSNHLERVLKIIAAIVRLEQSVPEGSARRNYGIALRRMYTKPLLKGLASLLSVPKLEADAVLTLQRGGADAAELLLDQLIAAPALGERRGIFDALLQMNAGREQLVPLLRHKKWYVVRNAAELIGEMGMQSAVANLAECLEHEDDRVRKAVALALTKIGSASTSEPLRRALRDKSPEVRVQVAVGVGLGGRRTTGLAMPIAVALQEEEDDTVRRELILALGRIGTPDAVQALIKIVQPAGFLFGRKPAGLRLAAVEALRLAGTAPALGTLEGLSDDGDKQVRAAAQSAVKELAKKKR